MGKQLALLVGCNNTTNPENKNEKYELYGCINDVNAMKDLLMSRFQFHARDITILTDQTGSTELPTADNIKRDLENMIRKGGLGANSFFYFSGNGTLLKPLAGNAKYNEGIPAIVSYDLCPIMTTPTVAFLLSPDPLLASKQEIPAWILFISPHHHIAHYFEYLVDQLKQEAIFTFVCDSSYSGGLFNEEDQIKSDVSDTHADIVLKTIPSGRVKQSSNVDTEVPPSGSSPNNRILLSSSKANDESVEVYPNSNRSNAYGAYTNAIQLLFNTPPKPPNTSWDVVAIPRTLLGLVGFNQNPFLWCSDNNRDASFLLKN